MKVNRSYQIGLLVFCSCLLLYFGTVFLMGGQVFSTRNIYYVSYPVNKGLSISAPVHLKGHIVGRIKKVDILPDKGYSTLVTIEVDKKFPLTVNSTLTVSRSSIFEGNILELDLQAGKLIEPGSTVVGQISKELDELGLQNMMREVTTLVSHMSDVMGDLKETTSNIKGFVTSAVASFDGIADSTKVVANDLKYMSHYLADHKVGLVAVVDAVNKICDQVHAVELGQSMSSLHSILQNADTLIQNIVDKQGSCGLFINDAELYNKLNLCVKNLDNLLVDIRKKPHRYINFTLWGLKK